MNFDDIQRNEMKTNLFCSLHPKTPLQFNYNLSKIEADSTDEINIRIIVHPCELCLIESQKLENALRTVIEVVNSKKNK